MKVQLDIEVVYLNDMFAALYLTCNLDYLFNQLEKLEIGVEEDYKDMIAEIGDLLGDDIGAYKKYFKRYL